MSSRFIISETNKKVCITFFKDTDEEIMKSLLDLTNNEVFYNDTATVSLDSLFEHISSIKSRTEAGNFALIDLLELLNEHFKDNLVQLERMISDNRVSYKNLTSILSIGTKFIAKTTFDQEVGGMVAKTEEIISQGIPYFVVTGSFLCTCGASVQAKNKDFYIPYYSGVRTINDLEVRPITPSEEEKLKERGSIFATLISKPMYKYYTGNMWVNTFFGPQKFPATGRIMVDPVSYSEFNPSGEYESRGSRNRVNLNIISEDMYWNTWPFMQGFSFSAKRWGQIFVNGISDIQFDTNAFDCLVLEEETKRMMKSLVLHSEFSFKDIISEKSGSCIFLLHGPPGIGKTLTCESISEMLQLPLYSVTVGELGTTPQDLESQLTRILAVANMWKAIILLDEADVFMETRSTQDVNRNAMVSIFLRLLERNQSIMFLTTNRADNIDPAFKSRISITIPYKQLDFEARRKVWINLLKAAKLELESEHSLDKIATLELNGRQIKNTIRMAQSLSIESKVLTDTIIYNVVKFVL